MGSPPDDRTARARIRDEALRLFADRGPDVVTVRDVAAEAGVSAALIIQHYGSKDGLREEVDEHVVRVFETMLAKAVEWSEADLIDQRAAPTLAETVVANLPADSAVPAYLGRLLVTDAAVGSRVFRRLYEISHDTLARMAETGTASTGPDPDVRAAFLLVNDLAVLILRDRLSDVLGVDPLSAAGMRRWGSEVLSIFRDGLGPCPDPAGPADPVGTHDESR